MCVRCMCAVYALALLLLFRTIQADLVDPIVPQNANNDDEEDIFRAHADMPQEEHKAPVEDDSSMIVRLQLEEDGTSI